MGGRELRQYTYDRILYARAIVAKSAIAAGYLIAADGTDQFFHLAYNVPFCIDKPILYAGSAVASGASGSNNYTVYPTSISVRTNSGNAALAFPAYRVIYIRGTLEGLVFTPADANLFTDIPVDDGSIYMVIGQLYDTYRMTLYGQHDLFMFRDGVFKSFAQIAAEAEEMVERKVTDVRAEITNLGDSIRAEVAATYAAQTELGTLRTQLSTLATQTATDFTWAANEISQIIVTYEEAASEPSVRPVSVAMGSAVTVATNRVSTAATHTLKYSFGSASGTIATGVGDTSSWTPPLSLASQIPSATSGVCTITCETYYGGVLTGTRTCPLTLTVPSSVVPTISGVSHAEAVSGLAAQFGVYVQTKSKLNVAVSAAGAYGSTITSYHATLNGATYTAASFTTGFLTIAGNSTLSVTVTDSRGSTATTTRTISVTAYAPPTISAFTAERCNSAGTAPQQDGTNIRITVAAGASSISSNNTMSCIVYYRLSSATVWTQSQTIAPSNYAVSQTNLKLSQTFSALSSYDIRVAVTDYFTSSSPIDQVVSVGTKQVMIDLLGNGTGIAFGKIAEVANTAEFAWPLSPGGTSTQAASAQNLLFLGTNPDFEDTVGNWGARGFGWVWCTAAGTPSITDKPASYGFLLNIPVTGVAELHQMFFTQNHGSIWHRGGNGSGWGGTWKRMFDNADVLGLANGGTGVTSATAIRNLIGLGNTTAALPIANGGHGGTTLADAQANLGFGISTTTSPAVSSTLGTIDYFRLYKVGKMVTFNMRYSTALAAGTNTEAAIIPSAYRPADAYVPLATYYVNNTITIGAYTTNAGILLIRPSASVNNAALSGSWVTA